MKNREEIVKRINVLKTELISLEKEIEKIDSQVLLKSNIGGGLNIRLFPISQKNNLIRSGGWFEVTKTDLENLSKNYIK